MEFFVEMRATQGIVGQIVVQFASKDQSKSCFFNYPCGHKMNPGARIPLEKKTHPPRSVRVSQANSENSYRLYNWKSVADERWKINLVASGWVIRPAMTCEQAHRLIGHAAFRLTDCFCCIFLAPSSRAYIMKRTRRQGRLLIALAAAKTAHSAFCAQIGRHRHAKRAKIPAYCWLHG